MIIWNAKDSDLEGSQGMGEPLHPVMQAPPLAPAIRACVPAIIETLILHGLCVLRLSPGGALCHTGDSGGHRGRACVGHLHDLLACLQQGSAYLCEAIEAQTPDGLCLILCATPTPDDDREGREPGPQPFTEIARPGKASGGHKPNTDQGRRALPYQREHFSSE